jgi:hypothetical protein
MLRNFFLFHVSNRTYGKKREYFRGIIRNTNRSVEFQMKASMEELLGNTTRVCDTHCRVAFDISTKKKSRCEIAVSVPDKLLQKRSNARGLSCTGNSCPLHQS